MTSILHKLFQTIKKTDVSTYLQDKYDPDTNINGKTRKESLAQACNPSTLGGQGGWITRSTDRDHPGEHGETPSLLKIQKISWARWCVPVVPPTWEAKAGELPEPGKWRLQ